MNSAAEVPSTPAVDTRVAAFIDVDADGRPDLYLGRIGRGDGRFVCTATDGGADFTCHRPVGQTEAASAMLLHNVDGARFVVVPGAAGASNDASPHSVAVVDWNGDGRMDLLVGNDFGLNRLYVNQGGAFIDLAPELGLDSYNHAMGTAVMDFAGSGGWDLCVADYGPSQLWLHAAAGPMIDQGWPSGLAGATRADSNWAPLAVDFDQDGRVDIFMANSATEATQDDLQPGENGVLRMTAPQRDLVFLNRGEGPVFAVGELPHAPGIAPAVDMAATATADFDGDGDVDIAEVYGASPALVFRLLRNDLAPKGHWLQVRVPPEDVGATVTLVAGGRPQRRSLSRATGSLGESSPVGHFGLGSATRVDRISVLWPSGRTLVVDGPLAVDRVLDLSPRP